MLLLQISLIATETLLKHVHFSFPFVDRLGDGYSHFLYENRILLTYSNAIVIAGAASYGQIVVPARFIPQDEAYGYVPPGSNDAPGTIFQDVFVPPTSKKAAISSKFTPTSGIGPWPYNL